MAITNNGKARQFLAASILNLTCLSNGVSVGWSSPFTLQLRSSNPPVGDTPMTEEQISWMTSLPPLGGFLTISFCGVLSERIGRKKFALLSGLPFIFCWLLTLFAQDHIYLYVARLSAGVGGAMIFFIVPLYVGEIASEDVRGLLGSLLLFFVNVGVLLAYVGGAFLSYRLFASLSLVIPVVFLVAFIIMPETPAYLVHRNLESQAHESLMFFRGNDQVLVEKELTKLRSLAETSNSPSNTIKLSDLFKNRASRRGLIISCGLIAFQLLGGISAVMSYAERIFNRAGSSLSAETASIIIAVIQLFGSCASTMLIERAGRRLLTLVSYFGMTISHATVGLFFYLQNNKYDVSSISWLPLVALSTYIVTYNLGSGPVPFVVVSEVFSLDVISYASNVCFVCYFIVDFIAIRMFDIMMQSMGADGCFFMLASFCAASIVFTYCLLPETKGRLREDIVNELAGIRSEEIDVPVGRSEIKTLMNIGAV